ncbi:MAG: S8 family serine peptidase [Caloramator sp.]|nr:S8 family serine peptidase [Caloramator sp.]
MKKGRISALLTVIFLLMLLLPGFAKATEGEVTQSTPIETQQEEIINKQIDNTYLNEKVPFMGDKDGNKISDDLDDLIKVNETDEVSVIIRLKEHPSDKVLAEIANKVGKFKEKDRWQHALKGFSAVMTKTQVKSLSKIPFIERIELDREVKAYLDTSSQWTGVNNARAEFGVDGDRDGNKTYYSKNDVVIAIIDTGIDANHVDLDGGKVIGWYDVINGRTTPYDDNGHGTHVASIAAGTGEGNANYKGVAPGAALVGIKVLNSSGSGTTSGIISGINWMIQNKNTYNIRIGNMSLGSAGSSDGTDSLSVAVNNAVNNGIIMAVAAGNEGPGTYTIGSPAAAANAITVGSVYDPGEKGWVLSEFSNRGPTADGRIKPDITAPGSNITAAKAGTTSSYVTYSGTSMATPFISGVIALMLDANYSLTDSQVKNILYSSANVKDFGPSGKDIDFGYGIALPYNCIKQAGGFSGSFSDNIGFTFIQDSLTGTGNTDWWQFNVTDTTKPIGITFIISNYTTSIDFDIYLYNPSGTLVAKSEGSTRQEQIRYLPTSTGTYKIKVYSYKGSGNYWFNLSWK